MDNPEIKVLIDEIAKLRSELIEMKMEIAGLKADVLAIGSLNRKVITNTSNEISNERNNSFRLIRNKIDAVEETKEIIEEKTVEYTQERKNELIDKIEDKQNKKNSKVKKPKIENKKEKTKNESKSKFICELKIDKNHIRILRDKLKEILKSDLRYDTWLKIGVNNLSRTNNDEYIFPAANDFTRGILEVRYRDMIEDTLKEVFSDVKEVKFVALDEASLA
ncbi:hypothetical protein [uncultured Clostridium sp.]|uniref:hypothetical protein n=1 Tax=uncultured Clostridium sp. TaxID=59620 RepID=UPI00260C2795|nr:hypothetical protein [uncultured Clostridium sp.]